VKKVTAANKESSITSGATVVIDRSTLAIAFPALSGEAGSFLMWLVLRLRRIAFFLANGGCSVAECGCVLPKLLREVRQSDISELSSISLDRHSRVLVREFGDDIGLA